MSKQLDHVHFFLMYCTICSYLSCVATFEAFKRFWTKLATGSPWPATFHVRWIENESEQFWNWHSVKYPHFEQLGAGTVQNSHFAWNTHMHLRLPGTMCIWMTAPFTQKHKIFFNSQRPNHLMGHHRPTRKKKKSIHVSTNHGWDQVKVWTLKGENSHSNAPQSHFSCFLQYNWILKSGCLTHDKQTERKMTIPVSGSPVAL